MIKKICGRNEDLFESLFADLNNTLDTQKTATIYNMDETSVFFFSFQEILLSN